MSGDITTWPDFPLRVDSSRTILSPGAVAMLIGQDHWRVTGVQRVGMETRNPVYRLWTADSAQTKLVKWFLPELDAYFDSRYRREEKVLWLLNHWFRNQAPELYGGIITSSSAVLVEQHLGEQALDILLEHARDEAERFSIALQGVEFLAHFHQVCQSHYTAFYRTCYSVELDRLNHRTYLNRAKIAIGRLLLLHDLLADRIPVAQAAHASEPGLKILASERCGGDFFQWYSARVIAPLVRAPRQIVHNSFSPFHLILKDDHLYLIDFETMSVGAAQVDLAEFIGAPEVTLGDGSQELLVHRYYELRNDIRLQEWPEFMRDYYSALASRSLDYAGVAATRCIKYVAQQRQDKVQINLERAREYRRRLLAALAVVHEGRADNEVPEV